MTFKKTFTTLLLILLAAALVAGAVLLRKHRMAQLAQASPPAATPWALTVAPVRRGALSQGFDALGVVSSGASTRILPQISGTILKMGPREGVKVKQGDLLAEIDTRELRARLEALQAKRAAARAEARRARNEARRERKLLGEGGSSATAVEKWLTAARAAEAQVKSLTAEIAALRVKLGYGRITAPFDATIARRLAEPGDVALPGKPIYVLSAARGGRVTIPVPLQTLRHLRVGSPVILSLEDDTLRAAISRIDPTLDQHAMGRVEIDLPQRPFDLPDGARLPARVITREVRDALIVPPYGLAPGPAPGQGRVYAVVERDGRPVIRVHTVRVLLSSDQGHAVADDLPADARVVVAHPAVLLRLHDGDPVQPIAREADR